EREENRSAPILTRFEDKASAFTHDCGGHQCPDVFGVEYLFLRLLERQRFNRCGWIHRDVSLTFRCVKSRADDFHIEIYGGRRKSSSCASLAEAENIFRCDCRYVQLRASAEKIDKLFCNLLVTFARSARL